MKVGDTLYRAKVIGDFISYDEWQVVRLTPKGMWIDVDHSVLRPWKSTTKRWVSETTPFVSPTKDEAVIRLRARSVAWVKHAKRKLQRAEKALKVSYNDSDLPALQTLDFNFEQPEAR